MYYDETTVNDLLSKAQEIAFRAMTAAYKHLPDDVKSEVWHLIMDEHADVLGEIREELGIELCEECGELLDACECEEESEEETEEATA